MRHAHRLGMSTTATMMFGHVETLEERVEHMRRVRELQDETGGFRAFISWTFQRDGNRLSALVADEQMPTSFDYLRTQAVSRIYLDNVPTSSRHGSPRARRSVRLHSGSEPTTWAR